MNGDKASIDGILDFLAKGDLPADVDTIVAPPALYIPHVQSKLPGNVQVAAQNCYKVAKGAFTGEHSPAMLRDLAIGWVVLGHSERRHVFGESDQLVAEKTQHALAEGVKVILCIGEKLDEREGGRTKEVCFRQLQAVTDLKIDWTNVVIAYEPVWAIGTGKVASPEQAQETHEWVRQYLKEKVNDAVAGATRIIYGGSVTADNCGDLAGRPDIDGFLVGGASLKPDFVKIVKARK